MITIQRDPEIRASSLFVSPGGRVTVWVALDERLEGATRADGGITMALPDQPEWNIDVVLSAPGFVEGEDGHHARLLMPRHGRSSVATFELVAGRKPGRNTVRASFFFEGRYLGKASTPLLIGTDLSPPAPRLEDRGPPTGGGGAHTFLPGRADGEPPEPPVSLQLGQDVPLPDLTLLVRRTGDPMPAGGQFEIYLISRWLMPTRVAFHLPPEFAQLLEARYAQLARRSARAYEATPEGAVRGLSIEPGAPAADPGQTEVQVTALGRELEGRVPAVVRDALRRIDKMASDEGRRMRIQVQTDDPIFPWELLTFRRSDDTYSPPLGIHADMARWHVSEENAEILSAPPVRFAVDAVLFVAPHYRSGALTYQLADVKALPEPVRQRLKDVTGTQAGLRLAVQDPARPAGILHFSGHGEIEEPESRGGPKTFALQMEDGPLASWEWRGMLVAAKARPSLIFLNACGLGREQLYAGAIEGWAPEILKAGASGYIGSLWPVGDVGAARFAQQFYSGVFAGKPVAQALAEARGDYRTTGDPTSLAYVFYGDVALRVYVE